MATLSARNAVSKAAMDALRSGVPMPPAQTLNAVAAGNPSTSERNAVVSWGDIYARQWRAGGLTVSELARAMAMALVVAGGAVVAQAAGAQNVVVPDNVIQAVEATAENSRRYEMQVPQTKQVPSVKLSGVGYRVAYKVDPEEGNPPVYTVSLVVPDVENQLKYIFPDAPEGGVDNAFDAICMVPYITGRDGAEFLRRVCGNENGVSYAGDAAPEFGNLGLYLLTHRLRHSAVLESLQVQVPQDLYPYVAGGTAEVWVDGDLVYEDADGVLFARALQGDATPAELPLGIAVEAHSKVEVILELGSPLVAKTGEDTYFPAISGALRVSRI